MWQNTWSGEAYKYYSYDYNAHNDQQENIEAENDRRTTRYRHRTRGVLRSMIIRWIIPASKNDLISVMFSFKN